MVQFFVILALEGLLVAELAYPHPDFYAVKLFMDLVDAVSAPFRLVFDVLPILYYVNQTPHLSD